MNPTAPDTTTETTTTTIDIDTYRRAAVPRYAPCVQCGKEAVHVLTDGTGACLCHGCAEAAAVAMLTDQFHMLPPGQTCSTIHGFYSPAVRADRTTGNRFCAHCFDRIFSAVKNLIAR